jgi:type IV pilus assembly protein PilA
MLARMRKSMDEKDQGFTLIELLVVMIIIGILAAIAIPVFLSQRKKAQDSAAKADVSTLGKEIATYYVDGTGSDANAGKPKITAVGGRYQLDVATVNGEAAIVAQDLGKASNNVTINNQFYTDGTAWCISVQNTQGDKAVTGMKYSAAGGLVVGAVCTNANG